MIDNQYDIINDIDLLRTLYYINGSNTYIIIIQI